MAQPRDDTGPAAARSRSVWRAAPTTTAVVIAFLVVVVVVIPLLALSVFHTSNPGIAALLLGLCVLSALYAWRFGLHPAIVARPSHLTIRNPLRSYRVAWADVRTIAPGPDGLVVDDGHRTIEAWCVQKSSRALRDGTRARADTVTAALWDYRSVALAGAAHDAAAPRRAAAERADAEALAAPPRDDEPTLVPGHVDAGPRHVLAPIRPVPIRPVPIPPPTHLPQRAPATAAGGPAVNRSAAHVGPTDSGADAEPDAIDLVIRRATLDSVDLLAQLERAARPTTTTTADLATRWQALLAQRGVRVRLAELDGTPVGYLAYGGGEILRLAVVPDQRRHGIGRRLAAHAEHELERGGPTELTAWVPAGDPLAYAFGHALRFTDSGERRNGPCPPDHSELRLVRPTGS